MDAKEAEQSRLYAKIEVIYICPYCEREIPPECIEVKEKEESDGETESTKNPRTS